MSRNVQFADRRDAGQRLAEEIVAMKLDDPLVLALPRGGVPVAFEIAKLLGAPMDLLFARKIGAPGQGEYAIGAMVGGADPQIILNDDAVDSVRASPDYVKAETQRQRVELERQRSVYLDSRQAIPIAGRNVVLVDDGIATGSTVRIALRALRTAGAGKIVLAVPVAPADAIATLRPECDDIICLSTPPYFRAVGFHYADFSQTSDHDVVALLQEAQSWTPPGGGHPVS